MRQQLSNLTGLLRRQSHQHILEKGIWIMPVHARRLDQAHDRSRPLATAQRHGKQPVRAAKRPRPYLVFNLVVVDGYSPIV